MKSMKRLWIAFSLVMVLSFLVLGWIGTRIYQEMPPLPAKVVTTEGTVLVDEGEIQAGQNVWQSLGGMEVGSVWGHGSYVAPDWTADWLHREATFILDRWAKAEFGADYARLGRGTAGPASRPLGEGDADQHLRPRHQNRHRRTHPGRSLPSQPQALQRRFRQRQGRVRHPCGRSERPRPPAEAVRLLLLDLLGGFHEPAQRGDHLHAQLALRTFGRQPAHGRNGRLDRREHHHAAGGHLGDGLVVRRPQRHLNPYFKSQLAYSLQIFIINVRGI